MASVSVPMYDVFQLLALFFVPLQLLPPHLLFLRFPDSLEQPSLARGLGLRGGNREALRDAQIHSSTAALLKTRFPLPTPGDVITSQRASLHGFYTLDENKHVGPRERKSF